MHLRKLVAAIAALAGLSIVVAAHSAQANSYTGPAFPGVPNVPSEAACWSNSGGALTQNCAGGTRRTCFPLTYAPATGQASVGITAQGINGSQTVTCFAESLSRAAYFDSWSGYATVPYYGSAASIPTLNTWLSNGDSLYACCDVGQGATVYSVWWNTP